MEPPTLQKTSPKAAEIKEKHHKNAANQRHVPATCCFCKVEHAERVEAWAFFTHTPLSLSLFFLSLFSLMFVWIVLRVATTNGTSVPDFQNTPSKDKQPVASSTHPWPKSEAKKTLLSQHCKGGSFPRAINNQGRLRIVHDVAAVAFLCFFVSHLCESFLRATLAQLQLEQQTQEKKNRRKSKKRAHLGHLYV